MATKIRCFGNNKNQTEYKNYHDNEWGVPLYDDTKLFEALILEVLQAGLAFETVLKKHPYYRKHFYNFNPAKVALISQNEIANLMQVKELIKHKSKMNAIVTNAKVFLTIQQNYGCFSDYIWQYVNFKPIKNHFTEHSQVPKTTPLSTKICKDLKQKGMVFIGSVSIYAYIQAIGLIQNHLTTCFKYKP